MNSPISFAVVIPLYNKAAYIEACLTSVLCQSYPPKQVIIVDDGSNDEGPALVAKYVDQRIKLVRQSNAGPGAARNKGIEHAKMPWIAFIDADDIWHPDHLLIHSDAICQHPRAGVIGSKFTPSKSPQEAIKKFSPKIGHSRLIDYVGKVATSLGNKSLGKELFWSSSVSIRRELLRSLGGFNTIYPGEDTATWFRLALMVPVAATGECTASYRLDTGGLMDKPKDWSKKRILSHPLRLEILKALDAPHLSARREILRSYLNAIDANVLRGALYNECLYDARRLSQFFGSDVVGQVGASRHLLRFPPRLAILLVRGFKLARKLQRSLAGK